MRFQGKYYIVTGGASGIGREILLRLAREGAHILFGDRDIPASEAVTRAAREEGLKVDFHSLDLEDGASIDAFVAASLKDQAGLDGLVNCAGGFDVAEPFLQNTPAGWSRILQINLLGMMHLTQGLLPVMIAKGAGRIVNISSEAGRIGQPGIAAYSAAKAGVIVLTRLWAKEFARSGIAVNAIAPGPVDTPFLQRGMSQEGVDQIVQTIPLGRLGMPEDVANMAVFFLDDASGYITGQTIGVSGGLVMM